jgi:hypothetical protein
MSILVRAALLGGLLYVVSRAMRSSRDSNALSRSDARRLSQADDEPDETWPRSEQPSTTTT